MTQSGRCLLAALLALCAWAFPPVCAAGERVVYIYSWEDYFDVGVVADFEKRHNCRVEIDHYDSNDTMFEKVRKGGTGYDIIIAASNIAADLYLAGQLRELDHGLLPHLGEVEAADLAQFSDDALRYHVPYTNSVTGVGYNRKMVPDHLPHSWEIFAHPDFAGAAAMMNDMRFTIGAALKYLGKSSNSEDWDEINSAGQVLRNWKKNIRMFGVDEPRNALEAGELAFIQAYSGDILAMTNPDIGFFVPGEGSLLSSDCFVIPADADNPELAHAFINHFLVPENARRNMESIRYYMPNRKALEMVSDELRLHPAFDIPDDVRERCEPVKPVGNAYLLYEEIWILLLMGGI